MRRGKANKVGDCWKKREQRAGHEVWEEGWRGRARRDIGEEWEEELLSEPTGFQAREDKLALERARLVHAQREKEGRELDQVISRGQHEAAARVRARLEAERAMREEEAVAAVDAERMREVSGGWKRAAFLL